MKLRQAWFIAQFFGVLGIVKNSKKNTTEWMRIQTAKAWLRGVGLTRELVIYQTGIFACVMILILSVTVMEIALLFLIPMSSGLKAIAALVIGGIDFGVALGFLGHFLSAGRWLKKAAQYNTYLAEVLKSGNVFIK